MSALAKLRAFIMHPIWFYPLSDILRLVREDHESFCSRKELVEIIEHCEIHAAYKRGGYSQLTTRQKQIWNRIWEECE